MTIIKLHSYGSAICMLHLNSIFSVTEEDNWLL